MTFPLKTIALGVSFSMALGTAAHAVTEVPSVNAAFFLNEETGSTEAPALVNEGQAAVTVTETEAFGGGAIEYTVTNNMAGWDIVGFGVTNPGFYTDAFVDRSIGCILSEDDGFPNSSCWNAETVRRGQKFESALEAEVFDLLLGEDNVFHAYSFNEVSTTTTIIEDDVPRKKISQEEASRMLIDYDVPMTTAILSGTTMGGFYFTNGVAASNLFGFAQNNLTGQGLLFSNVNILGPIAVTAVPVPAGALLLTTGLFGLGLMRKKRS